MALSELRSAERHLAHVTAKTKYLRVKVRTLKGLPKVNLALQHPTTYCFLEQLSCVINFLFQDIFNLEQNSNRVKQQRPSELMTSYGFDVSAPLFRHADQWRESQPGASELVGLRCGALRICASLLPLPNPVEDIHTRRSTPAFNAYSEGLLW